MGLYERRRPVSSVFTGPAFVQKGLILFWVFTIIWCEVGLFYLSLKDCRWPGGAALPINQTSHILIVSDAQVKNPAMAPSWTYSFFTSLQHLAFKLHLEKTWRFAMRLQPDHVVFLGDMTASGRMATSDEEYHDYYQTFNHTFPLRNSKASVYYVPGNNDIGLNMEPTKSQMARRHYLKNFGPLNQVVTVRNHTLVLLDASGLVEEDNMREESFQQFEQVKGGPMEFVSSVEPGTTSQPTILFTHIPLSRPDTASCGPLREQGTIRRGAGTGYQHMIGKKASAFLLEHIRPSVVFSGDDRDYCEYNHLDPDTIREVTVKSFSTANNIRRPGFQLLSLVSPAVVSNLSGTCFDRPCFLPDQHRIHGSIYLPLILISFIILILSNLRQPRRHNPWSSDREMNYPPTPLSVSAWSPMAPPKSPLPSPLATIASGFRSPVPNSVSKTYAATPNRRAFSGSPSWSPLVSPLLSEQYDQGEDDDELYPTQYAARREEPSNTLLSAFHYENEEPHIPQSTLSAYFPAPKLKYPDPYMSSGTNLPWSWSFVYAGRRRRITVPRISPRTLSACGHFIWTFFNDLIRGRRMGSENVARDIVMDCAFVFFFACSLWGILAWCLRS